MMPRLHTLPRKLKNELGIRKHKRRIQRELKREVEKRVAAGQDVNLIVGAGPGRHHIGLKENHQEGWLLTDQSTLDALKARDWGSVFSKGTIRRIMAEHVVEHWTPEEFQHFLRIIAPFLAPNANLRVAVPDGFHPDPNYIADVQPGGSGPGSDDHEVLYTYQMMAKILADENWSFDVLEYFDEHGKFHKKQWDPADGFIQRSAHHDQRNSDNALSYTSLIVDLQLQPRS
jgi:predicted SAM-dependent methyltransferase